MLKRMNESEENHDDEKDTVNPPVLWDLLIAAHRPPCNNFPVSPLSGRWAIHNHLQEPLTIHFRGLN
jgi:hypothetical protein